MCVGAASRIHRRRDRASRFRPNLLPDLQPLKQSPPAHANGFKVPTRWRQNLRQSSLSMHPNRFDPRHQ